MKQAINIDDPKYDDFGEPEAKKIPIAEVPKKEKAPQEGIKFDGEKIRWSLVPWDSMVEVMHVLEHGAKKYSDDNWKKVPGARGRYLNALTRHLLGDGKESKGYLNGEKIDKDSGRSHLACIISSALFLLWFDLNPGKEPS